MLLHRYLVAASAMQIAIPLAVEPVDAEEPRARAADTLVNRSSKFPRADNEGLTIA